MEVMVWLDERNVRYEFEEAYSGRSLHQTDDAR